MSGSCRESLSTEHPSAEGNRSIWWIIFPAWLAAFSAVNGGSDVVRDGQPHPALDAVDGMRGGNEVVGEGNTAVSTGG